MKKLSGFEKFLKYNGMDEEHLNIAAYYVEHAFYKKGSYIFKQGEPSKRFFGIIKGKVSIRNKKTYINENEKIERNEKFESDFRKYVKKESISLINKNFKFNTSFKSNSNLSKTIQEDEYNKLDTREGELFILSDGMCFGEWGLIYDIPRTASAYTLEDTDVFFLDKDCFNLIFSKGIAKADNEKKNFIIKRIPPLKNAGKVHDILKKIIPIFCDNRNIIYTELDKCEFIYIVYQGECKMQKLYYDRKPKNKDEIIKNREKMITYRRLNRGAIAGLEIVTSCSNYNYSLISCKDQTILFKINLKNLSEIYNEILEYLLPIFKEQSAFLKEFTFNHKKFSSEMKLTSNKKIKFMIDENKFDDNKIIEIDKKINYELENCKNNKHAINDFKFNHAVVNQKEVGYFSRIKSNHIKRRRFGIVKTNTIIDFTTKEIMENYLNNKNNDKFLKTDDKLFATLSRIDSKFQNIKLESKNINQNNLTNFLEENTFKNSLERGSIIYSKPLEIKTSSTKKNFYTTGNLNTDFTTNTYNKFHQIKTQNNTVTNCNSFSPNSENSAPILKKIDSRLESHMRIQENYKNNVKKLNGFKPNKKIKINAKTFSNISCSGNPSSNLKMNKHLTQTLSLWNKTINKSETNYDSGAFDLPLLSINTSKINKIKLVKN